MFSVLKFQMESLWDQFQKQIWIREPAIQKETLLVWKINTKTEPTLLKNCSIQCFKLLRKEVLKRKELTWKRVGSSKIFKVQLGRVLDDEWLIHRIKMIIRFDELII